MNLPILKWNKNTKAVVWLSLALLILFFGTNYLMSKSFVPSNFQISRQEGSEISSAIVEMLGESIKNLEKIAEADRNYNFSRALNLVEAELEQVGKAKQKAAELTKVLDKMARAVQEITPEKARDLALESVASEISLISHLMIYNDILAGLLKTLEYKFSGDIRYDAKDVQTLVESLNKETREINALNELFNEKMREFDKITS
jgi:hypothetical protein